MYLLKIFGILAGRCGICSVVVRERLGYEGSQWFVARFDPRLRISSFFIETLSITGQQFFNCRKNGSDRLRKGKRRRPK